MKILGWLEDFWCGCILGCFDAPDWRWARQHQNELAAKYPNMFIAIKDRQVLGAWDKWEDAHKAVKHLRPGEYARIRGFTRRQMRLKRREKKYKWAFMPPFYCFSEGVFLTIMAW